MDDGAGFLRAISDNPRAEAPRMIYADWLDEHDRPRQAEFLRAEVEWAADPGQGREAQVKMARLSLLAWALEPRWVADTSMVAREVREAVEQLRLDTRPSRNTFEDAAAAAAQWPLSRSHIGGGLARSYGPDVATNWCVPLDCVAALCTGRDYWHWPAGGYENELGFHTHLFPRERFESEWADSPAGGPAWQQVATLDARRRWRFYLSVDRSSECFGAIFFGEDWEYWPGHPGRIEAVSPTTLSFLRQGVPLLAKGVALAGGVPLAEFSAAHAARPTPWLSEHV